VVEVSLVSLSPLLLSLLLILPLVCLPCLLYSEMPEPKHFIMTPNAEHSEATGIFEIVPAIGTWINYLLNGYTVPKFNWVIDEKTGGITVTLDSVGQVYEASVWWAYSCGTNPDGVKRRDFRILHMDSPCRCGISADGYCANLKSFWTREILTPLVTTDGSRQYYAQVDAPSDGRYAAFFIDIKYDLHEKTLKGDIIPKDQPGMLEFTSEVSVWPNTFPYEDCHGTDCYGTLL
jgi:hypothetical protein